MSENIKLTDLIRGLKHTDRVVHAHLEQGGKIDKEKGFKVRAAPANAPATEWVPEEVSRFDKAPKGQWE